MKTNVAGLLLSIIVLFHTTVVEPVYLKSIIEYSKFSSAEVAYVRNFTDKIIDAKQIDKQALADFSLDIASLSLLCEYTYYVDIKITEPTVGGGYSVRWIRQEASPGTVLHSGDIFTIEIHPVEYSLYQRISMYMLGTIIEDYTVRRSIMIR